MATHDSGPAELTADIGMFPCCEVLKAIFFFQWGTTLLKLTYNNVLAIGKNIKLLLLYFIIFGLCIKSHCFSIQK